MLAQDVFHSTTRPLGADSRVLRYFHAHPLLLLLFLSPGIPEYLSGSSSLALLVLNPLPFLLLLAFNIGLYFTGTIIVREAVIRWRKGWASVFLLGFAYAIVEEGLALRTLYNPLAPQVGSLGVYGHWLGVNWVWTVGLLLFHSAFSIALPIFLFHLAFPALKSKSLLSKSRLGLCLVVLAVDSIILSRVANYDPGGVLLLISGVMVSLFIVTARVVPAGLLKVGSTLPRRSPRTFAILGGLFFPSVILGGAVAAAANAPPWAVALFEITVSYIVLKLILRNVGSQENRAHKIALSAGLVTPVASFGVIASLSTIPLVLGADALLVLFIHRLWRGGPFSGSASSVPGRLGLDPLPVRQSMRPQ